MVTTVYKSLTYMDDNLLEYTSVKYQLREHNGCVICTRSISDLPSETIICNWCRKLVQILYELLGGPDGSKR